MENGTMPTDEPRSDASPRVSTISGADPASPPASVGRESEATSAGGAGKPGGSSCAPHPHTVGTALTAGMDVHHWAGVARGRPADYDNKSVASSLAVHSAASEAEGEPAVLEVAEGGQRGQGWGLGSRVAVLPPQPGTAPGLARALGLLPAARCTHLTLPPMHEQMSTGRAAA